MVDTSLRTTQARQVSPQALAAALLAVVPGALTIYFAFQTGAYFPGATAVGTLLLIVLLIGRALLADDPFAGMSLPLGLAAGALALLATWTLASAAWSDSSARALTEFDRALLYLLALVVFGSLPGSPRFTRWAVWGLAAGMTLICTAALITRTLPDLWSAPPEMQRNRLSYPIGYWNALGLVASLALIFCLHLTSSTREPRVVRILAAAAPPVLGSTLLFTFSRGPMVVCAMGIVAYYTLGRPRAAVTGLLATVPTTAIAVAVSYRADLLAAFVQGRGSRPLTAAGLAEAHEVAVAVALCALAAVGLRWLGALVGDRWLARFRMPRWHKRMILGVTAGIAVLGIAAGTWVATRDGWLQRQYDRLVSDPVRQTGDHRDRLLNPGLNRLDRWRVAVEAFGDAPLWGQGAGTYRLYWERHRPAEASNTDNAHSLYLETLAELGVVGMALLVATMLLVLGRLATRLRRPDRSVHAALLAAAVVWAVHAALDWDWEIPAVTFWLFCVGGLVLAAPAGGRGSRSVRPVTRAVVAGGLVVLAITPASLALSERRLSDSLREYRAGRCPAAVDAARSSISALSVRPEPYEIESRCQARAGAGRASIDAMNEAIRRDPNNWEYRYGLALARAQAGVDPRGAAWAAQRLNPRDGRAREAVRRFRGATTPASWRRAARKILRGG